MSMAFGASLPVTILGRLARSMFKVVLDRLNELDSRMDKMTEATDKLSTKVDDLATAIGEAIDQIESEITTIKAIPAAPTSTATPEDTAAINASADKIGNLAATIRSAIVKAKSELAAPAAPSTPSAPADTVSGASGNDSVVDGSAPAPVTSAPASALAFADTVPGA